MNSSEPNRRKQRARLLQKSMDGSVPSESELREAARQLTKIEELLTDGNIEHIEPQSKEQLLAGVWLRAILSRCEVLDDEFPDLSKCWQSLRDVFLNVAEAANAHIVLRRLADVFDRQFAGIGEIVDSLEMCCDVLGCHKLKTAAQGLYSARLMVAGELGVAAEHPTLVDLWTNRLLSHCSRLNREFDRFSEAWTLLEETFLKAAKCETAEVLVCELLQVFDVKCKDELDICEQLQSANELCLVNGLADLADKLLAAKLMISLPSGDPATSRQLARMYFLGNGVEVDFGRSAALHVSADEGLLALEETDDADLAQNLDEYCEVLVAMEQWRELENCRRRTLELQCKSGHHGVELGDRIADLAEVLRVLGRYVEAGPLYGSALAIYRNTVGEQHSKYGNCCFSLAMLHHSQSSYKEAERLFLAAIKVQEDMDTVGVNHLLEKLGDTYVLAGRIDDAIGVYKRCLESLARLDGVSSSAINGMCLKLGRLSQRARQYDNAERYFKRILQNHQEDDRLAAATRNHLGDNYLSCKRYDDARTMFESVLRYVKATVGEEHPNFALILTNLGECYRLSCHYAEAEEHLLRSVELHRRLQIDDDRLGNCLHCLGLLYSGQQKWTEATPVYEELLCLRTRQHGENSPNLAPSTQNLGIVYVELNRNMEGSELLKRAIQLRWGTAKQSSLEDAVCYDGLAKACLSEERLGESEAYYRESVELRKASLGSKHPATRQGLVNLSEVLLRMKRCEEAENELNKARSLRSNTELADEVDVSILRQLAVLHRQTYRYRKAESVLQHAAEIARSLPAYDSTKFASVLSELACSRHHLGDFQQAIDLLEECLLLRRASACSHHQICDLNRLALVYASMERYSDGLTYSKEALVLAEQQFGLDHIQTSASLHNLAMMYEGLEEFSEAESLIERALALESSNVVAAQVPILNTLGRIHLFTGNHQRAGESFATARRILEREKSEESPSYASVLNGQANLLMLSNRYPEAESLLERVLKILEAAIGDNNHVEVGIVLHNLAEVCWAAEKKAEAVAYIRSSLRIFEATVGRESTLAAIAQKNLLIMDEELADRTDLYQRSVSLIAQKLGTSCRLYQAILDEHVFTPLRLLSRPNFALG